MVMINIFGIILTLCLLCFVISRKAPRKILIDTDPGGDDALALMLALMYEAKTHDIEILAIGVSYGNTYLENTTKNILKILTVADKKKLVYAGADKPLINKYESDNFFGDDGFGDFNFTQEITAKIDRSKHASVAYVDLVKKYPGEITIISLGSLTTIATAIALEPNFLSLIKQHIIMGASLKPNETEFNFQLDPESDWIALNNVDKPSIIVPIDTVYSYVFSQEEYINLINNLDKPIASFLEQTNRKAIEKDNNTWTPADGITMAIALQPEIITQYSEVNLKPVLVGDARGSVVINSNSHIHNARVVESFDKEAFKKLVLQYLSKLI
ncbi:PREDICTED: inosine-uridine preferring nucleoside hydrolase-like [Trachymyrmex septentrionalis]|uniref:inosine-uridine preferring nucleoside hydrolase-like n=1 Tax=Trachymyrmex septentrionalis TaxID=34720 RepID=UPI00084EEA53|nr:PREDICTED: inosine-uridine preferring nucleoside hydrolase-like [Trachymyrmex septentrionalis]XP_018344637.1 PREDICTED: inosine-uridine preferring nucleoside hydrolase-like [Trachymyrmex septentrionalis]